MFLRKQAVSRCYSFPPHLTSASALPEKMQQFRNSIISLKMLYLCFASFKQSPLYFFKLVESRLIFMLLYDSLYLIISGVHQSYLGSLGHRSENVKLRGLDCVAFAYKMCQCAVLLKDQIIIRNVFGSLIATKHIADILWRWQNTLVMLSIDMQFMLDEEKLPFLTWRPSGLTPRQAW